MASVSAADAAAVIGRVRDDPEWFASTILGHDLWDTQRAIMRAIAAPRARVAIKGCHASGKTFTAADLVLWWVYTGGIALTTAPTSTQVKKGLWVDLHRAYHGARFPLGGVLNQQELRISAGCYALGLATNQGVRFQGFHGRVLIVVDEAPGMLEAIFDAIRGIRAGGDVRLLVQGNPVIPSGPFHDAFGAQRAGWQTFTISAFDTPNLAGLTIQDVLRMTPEELDDNPRDYLPTRHWVKEMYEDLGTSSPLYASRVLGQFPDQSEDALLSLAWLEAARDRAFAPREDDTWAAGLDVAGPGEDETVLAIRRGARITELHAFSAPDPRGEVVAALRPYRGLPMPVYVDCIGIGYYMARHVESELATDGGLSVVDVNVGTPAGDTEKYANRKAELYWGLRQRAEAGDLAGLHDDRAIGQLCGIRYKHSARGQVVIESKDDARRRGVKSPDRAEAIMLAFADGGEGRAGVWLL